MNDEGDIEKAVRLIIYLTGVAFDFFFETPTFDYSSTKEANDYSKVKAAIIERFSPKKPQ